jgi:hypothetical protein
MDVCEESQPGPSEPTIICAQVKKDEGSSAATGATEGLATKSDSSSSSSDSDETSVANPATVIKHSVSKYESK